ncbi:MAG: outer membrane beta-barrel protein [Gammaproteobacteria bacterium]|nr:outer membrane beta-barrel protein [Gammaproteobacteria bacterium]MDH3481842.1 outer membrane beta-barrel protein [Gammaproteobacteria bacterium]
MIAVGGKLPAKMSRVLGLAVALGSWAVSASAQDTARRFELSPLLGYVIGGTFEDESTRQHLDLDDSQAHGLQLNIRADPQSTYEIRYAKQATRTNAPGLPSLEVVIEKLEIGGTYEVSEEPTRPFVALTLGASRFKPDDSAFNDDTYFSFSLGGGVKFFMDQPFGITVDARWAGAFVNEDTDVFCLSAGGLTCLIQADAGLTSQFRVLVGFNARF